jgi:hypothetical protein
VASGWVLSLLALEIELAGRAPANRDRIARADPADEHGERALGAPRIHGELLKLGFSAAQSTVARYMVKRRGPPSQGGRTFLPNHAPDIAAMDLFVVPTIGFKLLYAFVVVRLAEILSGSTSQQIRPPNGLRARSQKHSRGMKLRAT